MKTVLTELIERLEEKIKICSSTNLEREAMGMIEAKAIATELLEKEREQIEKAYYRGKSDYKASRPLKSKQYYKEIYEKALNQNK